MQRFVSSLFIIILILGGSYFAMTKYAPQHKTEIDGLLNKLVNSGEELIEKIATTDVEQATSVTFNSNSDSNIPMVITSADKNSLVAFSKTIDDKQFLEKIVYSDNRGKSSIISINELGYPTQITSGDNTASYTNYDFEKNTVDVVAIYNGTRKTETIRINNDNSQVKLFDFIPTVHAQNNGIAKNTIGEAKEDYYIGTVGQVWSVISCGGGIGLAVVTSGGASPLLALSCGIFLTRVISSRVDIGSCTGDVVECGKNAIINAFDNAPNGYTHETQEAQEFFGENKPKPEIILDLNPDTSGLITDGTYQSQINISRQNNGLTEKLTGQITTTFSNSAGDCAVSLNSTNKGVPNPPPGVQMPAGISLPEVTVTSSVVSNNCFGNIDMNTGEFQLSGKVNITANSGGKTVTSTDTLTVNGVIVSGKMSGHIQIGTTEKIKF